jgi:predicted pyridoxine 5'-phosphate oxidase superfamily flavin-nucleotide-binding protein
MSPFHAGELEAQGRQSVREEAERLGRTLGAAIPPAFRVLLRSQRMAVAATLDAGDRPWASLLSGPEGFIQAADSRLLHLAVTPPTGDALLENLGGRPELGLLVIDPRTRLRLRFNGRGLLAPDGIFLLADQVYGNCPKYIQKRRLLGESDAKPAKTKLASSLDDRGRVLVEGADTFFVASWHPQGGADASHRGGRPGFVRVLDERTLEFPDYPGNNMFNTLGNLIEHPRAGLLFVDFERGDLLQLSGRAEIRWGRRATVRVSIEELRETERGMGLRFELVEPSPKNPPLEVTT